jgi:hypothetical protein
MLFSQNILKDNLGFDQNVSYASFYEKRFQSNLSTSLKHVKISE